MVRRSLLAADGRAIGLRGMRHAEGGSKVVSDLEILMCFGCGDDVM
jgi:hypothetical protein